LKVHGRHATTTTTATAGAEDLHHGRRARLLLLWGGHLVHHRIYLLHELAKVDGGGHGQLAAVLWMLEVVERRWRHAARGASKHRLEMEWRGRLSCSSEGEERMRDGWGLCQWRGSCWWLPPERDERGGVVIARLF
jgi:hypothetical protein